MAERVAKFELQHAAERDNVASARNIPSRMQRRTGGGAGQYSSQGLISEGDFDMNEIQNDRVMNEEIRKLLEENKRQMS